MKTGILHASGLLLTGLLLSACTSSPKPTVSLGEGPYSFHDTRLRYALLTNDRRMLASDFAVTTETTLPEQIAAALVLPVSAATEIAVWPAASAFRAYYESE
jgi:hypothetical protein